MRCCIICCLRKLLCSPRCCNRCCKRPPMKPTPPIPPKLDPCERPPCQFDVEFRHNFIYGNENLFRGGTEIINIADCTISVFGTAFTWFNGPQFVFPQGGFSTAVEVWLDPDDIEEGELFTWSSSISSRSPDINGGYLSETFTHVRKIDGEIRLASANNGSSPQLNLFWTTSENSIAIRRPNFYTIITHYFEREGRVFSIVEVVNSFCRTIYKSPEFDHRVSINEAGGHGYGWFSLNTVEQGVRIKSIWTK